MVVEKVARPESDEEVEEDEHKDGDESNNGGNGDKYQEAE